MAASQRAGIQTYIVQLTPAAVPEPASVALFGSLLAGVFAFTRRARAKRVRNAKVGGLAAVHKFQAAVFLTILAISLQGCKKSPKEKEAAFLKKGEGFVAGKQYARAILEFRNAIRIMPKDAEPYYRLGIACLDGGDVFDAYRAFHRATELNPKHAQAQLKLAELLNLTGKTNLVQDAATRLKNILAISPGDEEATDALAIAEFQLGNKEDAARQLEESLRKFPARLKSSVALAHILLLKKDFNGAEETLKKAVAAAPDSSTARLALGQLYIFLRQPDKAQPEIAKAVQLDPKNAPALWSLARLQIEAKRLEEAESTLRRLSALPDKTYSDAHAMFLYRMGDRNAAIAELEKLVRDDPANRATRGKLLLVYLDSKRTQDAEKLLAAALKRNPKDTDALFARSQIDLKNGKPRQAEQDLDEVLHMQSNSARAHFALARVYAVEGMGNRERQEANEALRLDPGFLAARLALAKSFVLANQPQSALDLLDDAPAPQKSAVGAIEWRNWALLQAGNTKELRSSLDAGVARRQDSPTGAPGRPPENAGKRLRRGPGGRGRSPSPEAGRQPRSAPARRYLYRPQRSAESDAAAGRDYSGARQNRFHASSHGRMVHERRSDRRGAKSI